MRSYRTLALKELLAQRVISALILLAVILSTMMTAVLGQSVGILTAMRQQRAIALDGNRYASFVQMDEEQVKALQNDPRLSYTGVHTVLGSYTLDNSLILGLEEFCGDAINAYPTLTNLKEGRIPQSPGEVMLPEDVLKYLGFSGKLGDTITLPLSKGLRHGVVTDAYRFTAELTLVGITKSNYLYYTAGVVNGIVGEGTVEALLPKEYIYYNVDIRTIDKKTFQATVNDLVSTLHIHELDTTYNIAYLNALGIKVSEDANVDVSDSGFPFLLAAGAMVVVLVLLAAGLVIYNILKIAVSRRVKQYGTIRALGGEKRQLYTIVTAQVLLLCAVGIPVGLVLGALSAKGILTAATGLFTPEIFMVQDAMELKQLIAENSGGNWLLLATSGILTLAFALFAALPAASFAAKVSPVIAMSGTNAKVKRRGRRTKRIRNFERYYARLNMKRNLGRTVITILSLVMSITVFIALQGAVVLLDANSSTGEHLGDYSLVNETVGFSQAELETLENDPRVETVAAFQFSLYEQNAEGIVEGIDTNLALAPAETLQIVGLNDVYWEKRLEGNIPSDILTQLKEGKGCLVRNSVPIAFEGKDFDDTCISTGDVISIAGKQLTVLETVDNYGDVFTAGNNGFVNGVQIIVNEDLYQQLTGKSSYSELLPALAENVDRGEFDETVSALAQRVPGTITLSYEDTDRQLAESFEQIRLLAWGLILFISLIGLLNIVNTVYTNVHTRVSEIGTQRAIGMGSRSLYKVFLWEGAYYGLYAALIGSVTGYLCTIVIDAGANDVLRFVAVPVIPILVAALCSIGACLLATCIPLRRIAKMDIVKSIEAIE